MSIEGEGSELPHPPQSGDTPVAEERGQKPSSARNRKPWVIAGSVAVMFVVAAVAFVALGGGSDDDTADGDSTAAVVSTDTDSTDAPATTTAATTTTTEATTTTTTIATVAVPRFGSGTTVEEAQTELTGLGLMGEVVEEEGPGPYGVVVDTDPGSGADVEPGSTVSLTVNKPPANMPSVVGETAADAVDTLESYAITVSTSEVLSEDTADDTIISQTPEAGEPFAAEAQLVVNRRPAIVYLEDLDRVDSNVFEERSGFDIGTTGSGQAQVNGTVHTRTINVDPSGGDPGFLEYDLARSFLRLVGGVGLRDDVSSDSSFKVEIFLDGTAVFDETLGLGETADIDVDVTNVLRIRLQVTQIEGSSRDKLVFIDPRLLGLPGSVPTTTGG